MRYAIIAVAATSGYDANGNAIQLQPGTVVNCIAWSGETEYNAGDGFTLIRSDTLQIGDISSE